MRPAFRIVASLTSLAVIVQVGFAGYGAFNAVDTPDHTKKSIENGFDPHGALGYVVIALMIVLLLVALVSRHGVRIAAILLVLGVVQALLSWAATHAAWVGFFHGVNALAIAGIAGSLAGNEWRERRVASDV